MSDELSRNGKRFGGPKVWLLMTRKTGENSQVLALGEALGWPYEIKRLTHRRTELLTNLLLGPNLAGVVKRQSTPLVPPWPDVVISAGRRNEPVCRWIRQQACRSGKTVRVVHVGRPLARMDRFDLVVTTPQYRIRPHPLVLQNFTPLHRVTSERLGEAAARWAERLGHLPRPYVAVVVGGHSGPYTLDRRAAKRLGEQANAMAATRGGSLLVTTSARTSEAAARALRGSINCPADFYTWSRKARDNPYFAYLALADAIIVTGDSISMLTEACATRKPVFIFDLGEGRLAMRRSVQADAKLRGWRLSWNWDRPRAFIYRLAMGIGPRRLTRDIRIVHDFLVGSGRAVWLGDNFPPGPPPPPLGDIARTVARIRTLVYSRSESAAGVCEPRRDAMHPTGKGEFASTVSL
jgi:mitochondrial fission protein ELM1